MPNLKSAKKKLRKDIKRTKRNKEYLVRIERAIRAIKKDKSSKNKKELIRDAYSIIDRAAKRKIIHKNKAARLKSKVERLTKKMTKK
jgi:small subunit ribosomal protein S20